MARRRGRKGGKGRRGGKAHIVTQMHNVFGRGKGRRGRKSRY